MINFKGTSSGGDSSRQNAISSQSPKVRKLLTLGQEMELKAHLCLLFAAKIEETDDI